MNPLIRILLAPFSALYGLGIGLRNLLYDTEILKSASFSVPVINVGNLTVGGEGKTPHVEYLISLLQDYLNIATLSRGYKRKTKGFRFVSPNDPVNLVGDEPLQYKKKYPNNVVSVSESRALAIPEIIKWHPETQLVILDDAYQHLSVKPGLNILLTKHDALFVDDYLLPAGRLREWRSAYKRADIIVISKCPRKESEVNAEIVKSKIELLDHQSMFFSYYNYGKAYNMYNPAQTVDLKNVHVVLVSAIANTDYLMDYIEESTEVISNFKFEDHHYFSSHEMSLMKQTLDHAEDPNTVILTTEKDATRLHEHAAFIYENRLPIYILPVKVDFHYNQGLKFDSSIKDYLLNFKV